MCKFRPGSWNFLALAGKAKERQGNSRNNTRNEFVISEVGGVRAQRPQPGNRFVSFVRACVCVRARAARDQLTVT